MSAADEAWRAALRDVSIADLARTVNSDYDRDVLGAIRGWLAPAS
jgi:hypothetical protein